MINPFDVIIADEDGVVVVRPEMVETVLKAIAKAQVVDGRSMENLKRGRSVADTFEEHRGKK